MNPGIVDEFVSKHVSVGSVLWEPFAGHTSSNKTIDICSEHDVNLIAFDIFPSDSRVVQSDSTVSGPICAIDGVIFNPPYLSTSPMSAEQGELSICSDDDYFAGLRKTVSIISESMQLGKICVVGRPVKIGKEKMDLDWIFTSLFLDIGCDMIDVYSSIPDWVIVLERHQ